MTVLASVPGDTTIFKSNLLRRPSTFAAHKHKLLANNTKSPKVDEEYYCPFEINVAKIEIFAHKTLIDPENTVQMFSVHRVPQFLYPYYRL